MTDFGRDLSCLTDLTPTMAEVSGREGLLQAEYRRLQTPRGQLYRYRNYGFDLRAQIAKELGDLDRLRRGIATEMVKEQRVTDAAVDAVFVQGLDEVPERFFDLAREVLASSGSLADTALIQISLQSAEGPFPLTLAVSGVTLQLLGLTRPRGRGTERIQT